MARCEHGWGGDDDCPDCLDEYIAEQDALSVLETRAEKAERERDEARAELLHEYEIQQKECLSSADADTCDMCGGCHLTERIAALKGGEK